MTTPSPTPKLTKRAESVLAAIGSATEFASWIPMKEIASRCGLSWNECQQPIARLLNAGIISELHGMYRLASDPKDQAIREIAAELRIEANHLKRLQNGIRITEIADKLDALAGPNP